MKKLTLWLCSVLLAASVWAAPSADNMVAAAKGGDAETVKEGLQSGFDPNYKDRQGNSLLIHAAANSNAEIVALLLNGGADPAMQNKSGDDALNYGAIKGNLSIVKQMLKAGLPVNRKQGWQPLSYAIYGKSLDVFNYLMDQGADPNANNPSQASALMIAALQGQEEMAARLLKAGADPTWTKGGESAVDWALKNGNTDIADMVMKAQAQVGFGRSSILAETYEDPPEDELVTDAEKAMMPQTATQKPTQPR
jgi:ankyrin repeat protein